MENLPEHLGTHFVGIQREYHLREDALDAIDAIIGWDLSSDDMVLLIASVLRVHEELEG